MVWPSDEEEESLSIWENFTSSVASVRDTILPKQLRRKINNAASKTASYAGTGLSWLGNGVWVAATATLVLVLPLALEVDREQQLIEMEEQMKQQQQAQQAAQFSSMPGATPLGGASALFPGGAPSGIPQVQ